MREAGQADVAELTGLMRAFYAESGFALDEQRAAAGFKTLLGDARLGRVWLIEQGPGPAVDEEPAAAPDERAPPPAAGYIVVSFVFAMEYAGLAAVVDDFYVRPEARGEGLGKAALAAARRACEDLGVRAMRVEVGVDNLVAQAVYRSAGFEALPDHGLMVASAGAAGTRAVGRRRRLCRVRRRPAAALSLARPARRSPRSRRACTPPCRCGSSRRSR